MRIYLYKITNKINNRYYIGIHKARYQKDTYLGSGKIIAQAIAKYGEHNFEKEILEYFDTWEQALDREREIVTAEFVDSPETYNITVGGHGGFDYIHKHRLNHTPEVRARAVATLKEGYATGRSKSMKTFLGKTHTDETKQRISDSRKEYYANGGEHPRGMLGKTHTDEHRAYMKEKMSEIAVFKGVTGADHPAGNTSWYNDGVRSYRVKADSQVDPTWVPGRLPFKRKESL